jgi:hypothetical protein
MELQLKGKKAEEVVHNLAEKTFLTDWCFANPLLPNGKELCDLFVAFDSIAIIFQVKDLKLDKHGHYKKGEVEKNLHQLAGARRQLFDLKTPIELINLRRRIAQFDPTSIKEIYLLSILMGEEESFYSFIAEFKKRTIHVFTRDFTSIVLAELDTITDFCDYLRNKEALLGGKDMMVLISGGEEDLLAYYLLNGRSFSSLSEANTIFLEEGFWKETQQRSDFQAKKQADEISYEWDRLINLAHGTKSTEYELVAREMARTSRFGRRLLAKSFIDAHGLAQDQREGLQFRRVIPAEGITYCFLFDDRPNRQHRATILKHLAFIARGKYPTNKKVLGIATERTIQLGHRSSYDFLLWTNQSGRMATGARWRICRI